MADFLRAKLIATTVIVSVEKYPANVVAIIDATFVEKYLRNTAQKAKFINTNDLPTSS